MNEQQPYEKHLADKLRDLKPPGSASRSWPQMKALLDRDMPNTAGGAGGNRWWIIGTIAALLLIGTWAGSSLISGNSEPAVANKSETKKQTSVVSPDGRGASTSVKPDLSSSQTHNINEQKTSSNESTSTPAITPNNHSTNATADPTYTNPARADAGKTESTADRSRNNKPLENETVITPAKNNSNKLPSVVSERQISGTTGNKRPNRRTDNLIVRNEDKRITRRDFSQTENEDAAQGLSKKNSRKNNVVAGGQTEEAFGQLADDNAMETASILSIDESQYLYDGTQAMFPDSIKTSYALNIPAKARSRFKSNTPRVQALKNRVVGTGDDKNFALGLSLPLAFPLSDQKAFAYNVNAGANTALDYLPVPHLQYHINQKSYLQAEIQFASPQFINPALLYESKYERTGATNYRYVTNSVFAKKLYYFNLPLGIHYSPFKNFYLGSGVQFSSLMSGVAMQEQRGYSSLSPSSTDTLFNQSILKFRNDTLSDRLNNNEFRVTLDANYYWHRFTVGLRYNQALSNYVSLRVSNVSPLITDKNKSMQFYLRYNLWEDKKRKKTGSLAKK